MLDERISLFRFLSRMLDAGLTVKSIVEAYLSQNPLDWRVHAEIIPDYIAPFDKEMKQRCVVRYQDSFLRYSNGPHQGFFWDCYGDDMLNVGLAFRALIEAPTPPWLWFNGAHQSNDTKENQDG